jgi:hypothetical protein
MLSRNRFDAEKGCQQQQDDQQRITWREFLLLCGAMYRQILPGVLLLSGAIILAIMVLLLIAD